MRFGFCTNVNFLLNGDPQSRVIFDTVLSAGYDYIELPLSAIGQLIDILKAIF